MGYNRRAVVKQRDQLMHRFVPSLIVDNLRQEKLRGRFPCTGLFVDISGFTNMTESLMSHGQHGAEVMATIMRAIFAQPVRSVFAHGGFVSNFAGDAFTAVFPFMSEGPANPTMSALAAAWQIQEHMKRNARQRTRYGYFEFSVKIGLAAGEAIWGILPGHDGRRATYYLKGSAIIGSAGAEHHAQAGDIVVNGAAYEEIDRVVHGRPISDHWQIARITATLPEPRAVALPPLDGDQMARFFPRALIEQEISGEFRQVVNLFINLQGAPDHAQLDRFAQHLFQLQDKYGGFLNRIDFADKGCHMLLFWGAPTSFENDITRALDFILDCRRLSEIPLRAGITYRIAHAGSIGSELAEEFTCYGRGVNLAARHMMAAGWGEIWVDDETARRAQAEFVFETLGRQPFKGFAEPQPVYLLSGHREDIPLSPFGNCLLTGRQEEIDHLQKAVQPIYDGHFAGVVTLTGEAGIGKSRLLHEFLSPLTRSGETSIFLCQTDEIVRQSLNPFRYFLRHYFRQSAALDQAAKKRLFSEILDDLLASVHDKPLIDELKRTASFLGSLIGLYWEGSLYEQLEPELRFENTLIALKALFRAESRRRPVILQLEDAHWLDHDSQIFLGILTRNMADFPLCLLVTSREALPLDLFAPDTPHELIHLLPLGMEALQDMAQAILQRQPPPALLWLLEERTGGNPYYAEQLLLYLDENDLLATIIEDVNAGMPGDLYIPTDVRALLIARLDLLPTSIKEVVQYAAVLGSEFETFILYNMMAEDPSLESKLAAAAHESIWIALGENRYLFQHALLRDAAYDMQIHSRLRQLHKRAAQAYEDRCEQDPDLTSRYPQIAYHFDKAEERNQAARYYGEAGKLAKENYSNAEAVSYFSRGLELTGTADFQLRYDLLCGRETIFQWLGRRAEQHDDLEELAKLLDQHPDGLKHADLALRQSSYALVTGDYDAALAAAQKSLQFAEDAENLDAKARAYHRWGRTCWQLGHTVKAEGYLNHALTLVQAGENRDLEADCLYDLAMVFRNLVRFEDAKSSLMKAAGVYQELGDNQGLVRCQNLFGMISDEQGRLSESHHHYTLALDLCREAGWRYAETYILINLGISYTDLGGYKNALHYHNQALELAQETGDRHAEAVTIDSLGLISFYEGESAVAIEYFQKALAIRKSVSNQRSKAYVLAHLGFAQAQIGEHKGAESSFLEALKIRQDLSEEALIIDAYSGLALISFLMGNQDQALGYVNKILSWIQDNGTEGLEFPVQVFLICHEILSAITDIDGQLPSSTRAKTVLEDGYELLTERLLRISDEGMREQFIENVPYNRKLRDTWLRNQE